MKTLFVSIVAAIFASAVTVASAQIVNPLMAVDNLDIGITHVVKIYDANNQAVCYVAYAYLTGSGASPSISCIK